jgi:transcriptional regulator with XRE-family HTH domain
VARNNLALLRRDRHWTQEDLAVEISRASVRVLPRAISVSVRQINRWESADPPMPHPGHQRVLEQVFTPLTFREIWYGPSTPAAETVTAQVIRTRCALLDALTEVVTAAREVLVMTGSRARDPGYLAAIEQTLADHPDLAHYRVLYGPPRHPEFAAHLDRLLAPRPGRTRPRLGLVLSDRLPERFLCASESAAVVIIPSLTSPDAFDTAAVFGPAEAACLVAHGRETYASSRKIERPADLPAVGPGPDAR